MEAPAPPPAAGAASATSTTEKSTALQYYVDGCDTGEAAACANAARVLLDPASTYHDDVLAVRLRTRACDANAYFCGDLGQMYFAGKGVQKDETRGLAYLDRGCAAKNTAACSTTKIAHEQQALAEADTAKAKTTTKKDNKKADNKKPDTKKTTSDAKVKPR